MRKALVVLVGLLTVLIAVGAPGRASAQVSRQYLANLDVITGTSSISCAPGYTKNPQNLNQGAGGDDIYLCEQYQRTADNAITYLSIAMGIDFVSPPDCGIRQRIDVDLNKGAGGFYSPEICYDRSTTDFTPGNAAHNGEPVRDVWFWSTSSDPCPLACGDTVHDGCVSRQPPGEDIDVVVDDDNDLNKDAGGYYIYMCVGRGPAPVQGGNPMGISLYSRTPANANGWNNGSVIVTWQCSDTDGPPQALFPSDFLTDEGANQSATGTCRDDDGNSASDTQTGINIDGTPPSIIFIARKQPNAAGWNRLPVDVTWACRDGLSGPEHDVVVSTVTSDGVNQSASGTCRDLAGNEVSDTQGGIKLDSTPPTITLSGRSPDANADGWSNADVSVAWSCADALSGPTTPFVSKTVTGEGANLSATGTCSDVAGNSASATQGDIRIDRTPPVVSVAATTADGKAYVPDTWTNQDVTVTFSCSDALSGVVDSTPPQTYSADGAYRQVIGTCEDKAGNTAVARLGGTVLVDKTPPQVTCSVSPATIWPANDRFVAVTASVDVTDQLSGSSGFTLNSVTSSDAGAHGDIRGFSVGTPDTTGQLRAERGRVYTLTYAATDAAGNTATCSATVAVRHAGR
jgi:hypothetical protein